MYWECITMPVCSSKMSFGIASCFPQTSSPTIYCKVNRNDSWYVSPMPTVSQLVTRSGLWAQQYSYFRAQSFYLFCHTLSHKPLHQRNYSAACLLLHFLTPRVSQTYVKLSVEIGSFDQNLQEPPQVRLTCPKPPFSLWNVNLRKSGLTISADEALAETHAQTQEEDRCHAAHWQDDDPSRTCFSTRATHTLEHSVYAFQITKCTVTTSGRSMLGDIVQRWGSIKVHYLILPPA